MKQLQFDIVTTIQGGGLLYSFAPEHIQQDLYNSLKHISVSSNIEKLISIRYYTIKIDRDKRIKTKGMG
jgi:hypothetical protein